MPPSAIAPSARSAIDRKSTRLNSSHITISYAVFCLKKKTSGVNGLPLAWTRRMALRPSMSGVTTAQAGAAVPADGVDLVDEHDRRCVGLFFFNDTATTEIYTLSLHDALPI